MIDYSWIKTTPANIVSMLVSCIVIYLVLMICTRLAGLRSFSKLSSFDFAITVAFGTILASTLLTKSPALITGALAMASLYAIQTLVARLRRGSRWVQRLIDNSALLLMVGNEILSENLSTANVTADDLRAKLRDAGVTHRDQVLAVVFESTGDVSVLRRDAPAETWLFDDVRDAHRIRALIVDDETNLQS